MKHTKLLLTTGPGLAPSPNGEVIVVEWQQKRVIDHVRFTHGVHERNEKGIMGASWNATELLATTECELLEFNTDPLRLKSARSFPFLNDTHFLLRSNNRFWVCNTGLDCIEELDDEWNVVKTHDLLGSTGRRMRYALRSCRENTRSWYYKIRGWRKPYAHLMNRPRFMNTRKLLRKNAYRRNGDELRFTFFRPHVVHPNHLFPVDGDIWVTLANSGEIISLNSGRILCSGLGKPHDGIVVDDEHYMTDCKTNCLIVHELHPQGHALSKRREKQVTNSLREGFLRGIAVVGDRVFVGLTARRGAPKQYERACVLALDRRTLEPLDEWVIPEQYGKTLFTILDATKVYG